jgi:integrase
VLILFNLYLVKIIFKEILKKAGLSEDFMPYSLRHTHASLLLADGASIKDVSERLGHADASVTLRVYAHTLPNAQAE